MNREFRFMFKPLWARNYVTGLSIWPFISNREQILQKSLSIRWRTFCCLICLFYHINCLHCKNKWVTMTHIYFLGQIGCNSDNPWHGSDLPLEIQVKLTLIVLGHNYSKSVFVMTKTNGCFDYNSQNNPNSGIVLT